MNQGHIRRVKLHVAYKATTKADLEEFVARVGQITSKKTCLVTLYERYSIDGELIQQVGIYGFIGNYNGRPMFIIHDSDGKLIDEANVYLNKTLENASYKTREVFVV